MKVKFLKDQAICNDGIKIIRVKSGDVLTYPGQIDKSLLKPLKELGIITKVEEEPPVEEEEQVEEPVIENTEEDEEIIDVTDEDEDSEDKDITKKTIFQKYSNKKKRR